MELTAAVVERVPGENLRVPRDEFVAVWRMAERMADGDWYAIGVASACRWIGCASVPSTVPAHRGRLDPVFAPLSVTQRRAHPELIELEAANADRRLARHPNGVAGRPGWLEAVVATLDWVWRGSGRPPLDIHQASTG